MGRKCWAPAQPEHDLINNKATLPRKDAKAAPEYGYADFARGGALHKEPPTLGHHPLTKKNAAQTEGMGRRQAGLKSGLRPRGGGSWHAQPGWSLKEDNKPWELQGTQQPSEMTVRFKPAPKDFVPRVTLAKRHNTDQTCDLKGKHHVDYQSEHVLNYKGKTQPRVMPIPSKPAEVYLGSQSPSYNTANLDHFDDKGARYKKMAGRQGGGLPQTKIPPYNVITGGGEMTHYPKDHYGSARVHRNPRVPGDMPLLYVPLPQTNRAGYDIISGRDRPAGSAGGWTPYEHFGAHSSSHGGEGGGGGGAGATGGSVRAAPAGGGAEARTSRHERAGGGGGHNTGPMSTRPW